MRPPPAALGPPLGTGTVGSRLARRGVSEVTEAGAVRTAYALHLEIPEGDEGRGAGRALEVAVLGRPALREARLFPNPLRGGGRSEWRGRSCSAVYSRPARCPARVGGLRAAMRLRSDQGNGEQDENGSE